MSLSFNAMCLHEKTYFTCIAQTFLFLFCLEAQSHKRFFRLLGRFADFMNFVAEYVSISNYFGISSALCFFPQGFAIETTIKGRHENHIKSIRVSGLPLVFHWLVYKLLTILKRLTRQMNKSTVIAHSFFRVTRNGEIIHGELQQPGNLRHVGKFPWYEKKLWKSSWWVYDVRNVIAQD